MLVQLGPIQSATIRLGTPFLSLADLEGISSRVGKADTSPRQRSPCSQTLDFPAQGSGGR